MDCGEVLESEDGSVLEGECSVGPLVDVLNASTLCKKAPAACDDGHGFGVEHTIVGCVWVLVICRFVGCVGDEGCDVDSVDQFYDRGSPRRGEQLFVQLNDR